jgi:hypothetical protein
MLAARPSSIILRVGNLPSWSPIRSHRSLRREPLERSPDVDKFRSRGRFPGEPRLGMIGRHSWERWGRGAGVEGLGPERREPQPTQGVTRYESIGKVMCPTSSGPSTTPKESGSSRHHLAMAQVGHRLGSPRASSLISKETATSYQDYESLLDHPQSTRSTSFPMRIRALRPSHRIQSPDQSRGRGRNLLRRRIAEDGTTRCPARPSSLEPPSSRTSPTSALGGNRPGSVACSAPKSTINSTVSYRSTLLRWSSP